MNRWEVSDDEFQRPAASIGAALFFHGHLPKNVTVPSAIKLTPQAARRFLIRALLLEAPVPDVRTALSHHGYIQIDPINVCGRMHDLILRHRVAGYSEGDLMRYLHGAGKPLPAVDRAAFEHHLPGSHILVALPLDAWPHLLTTMHLRTRRPGAWSGRLTAQESELAPQLLAELAVRGPLGSEDLHDGRQSRQGWGTATLAKSTLQKLFFHGRVLIAARNQNRRLYDLPERVLPKAILAHRLPAPLDTARWQVFTKLRQRRLSILKRAELALVGDDVQAVAVPDCPPLYCLRDDLPALIAAADGTRPGKSEPLLLAPLDPLIYDRALTKHLWEFDYTWEVYTPPHKRLRGYYALPILSRQKLIGHVDPKADRKLGKLVVNSCQVPNGHRVAGAVHGLARWLGVAVS